MNENQWYEDIMLQKFSLYEHKDITKLLIVFYLCQNPNNELVWTIQDLANYIFDFYIDNEDISQINTNSIIRNIKKYGVEDVKPIIETAILEWKDDAKNQVLKTEFNSIILELDSVSDLFFVRTKQVANMIYKKALKKDFNYNNSIDEVKNIDNKNLELFGKSRFKNRLKRTMQYCVICDETKDDNLFAVHIDQCDHCDSSYIDVDNGIIMCKDHAQDYLDGKFYFNENGFVINRSSNIVDERMHLSFAIKNPRRKKYIADAYKKNGI